MNIKIENIKTLREKTQAPVLEIKKALENSKGDIKKARDALDKWSKEKALTKQGRVTSQGIIEAYVHTGSQIGSMIALTCETDFVARNENFTKLAHEIAMQVASMNPKDEKELLSQAYIRDPKKTIKDLIDEQIAKMGENIKVVKFIRYTI